ncbi:MAG: [protein-PII] uridylyltransferase [Acidimicrobiia bacterium]
MDTAALRARRAELIDGALRGPEFAAAYSALIEEWIREVVGDETRVVVIAGGALGRRDLAPASDLDLALVHDGRRDCREVANRLWYPIWDAGIALDHSVRSPKEAAAVAGDDLKVVLSLLDGRPIAGDLALGERTLAAVRERWISGAKKRLAGLEAITLERQLKEGDVAHLLEPDLKQAKGGLRDLRVLHALEVAAPIGEQLELTRNAADLLLTVRVELHRVAGRATDRLLLQYQDDVAARLEMADADVLMAEVAAAGRAVAWACDDAWARANSWKVGPKGRGGGGDRDLGPGIVLRDGEVDISADADLDDDALILRAAEAAARGGVRFRRGALERLAGASAPGDPWSPAAHEALIGLLGAGENLVPVVEALEHYGLMDRILPEWTPVRSRPQRNSLHRYTVDRHLVETVVQAARLTREVARPDLLLVGAWLHDLGKGYPGDHTDAGVALVEKIAPRLGFPAADVAVLTTLVREHLLVASVATSRDLSDPVTIDTVARAVGDRDTLELLAALTEADSLATGETVWSSWKAELVDDLVRRVGAVLSGEPAPAPDSEADPVRRALVDRAGGELLVEAEGTRVVVVAPDRPGLLAVIVGVLALRGQSVRSAVATTDDAGIAVDTFTVQPVFDRDPDWASLPDELHSALAGNVDLEARVDERSRRYQPSQTTAARPPDARVLVHLEGASGATVVEVRSRDDVGVLFRIARTFTALGLDIHQARAVTLGQEVVDTFYVRDAKGDAVDDRAPEITAVLMEMLTETR